MIRLRGLIVKATKGPFELLDLRPDAEQISIVSPAGRPLVIARIDHRVNKFPLDSEDEANAALIVHLLNRAEGIAEVIEKAKAVRDGLANWNRDSHPYDQWRELDAALKKLEEG